MERLENTRVLFYVQLKRRDLFGMRKLARALDAEGGFSARLSGTSDFPLAVMAFRPHIVVIGKPDNAEGDWLRCISGCTVLSLNPEQHGDGRERVLSNFTNKLNSERDQAVDLVDHHLFVDEQTMSFLTPFIDPGRMHLVGYPRLFAERYAKEPNQVTGDMVIGVACGMDFRDKNQLLDAFRTYQDSGFEPLPSIQAVLVSDLLEYLWINTIVDQLKDKYRIIVRYRHGDGKYLLDERGVELDSSATLEYLFANSDLVLIGRSSVGIEASMAGIPAIAVSSLFQLGDGDPGAKDLPSVQTLWQPKNLEDLLKMVERRSDNGLNLVPDLDAYEGFVRPSYFCGGEVDHSVENIVGVVRQCDPGVGATMDRKRFRALVESSGSMRFLLWFAGVISSRLAYRVLLVYLGLRTKWAPDAYLLHEAYIPELGRDT